MGRDGGLRGGLREGVMAGQREVLHVERHAVLLGEGLGRSADRGAIRALEVDELDHLDFARGVSGDGDTLEIELGRKPTDFEMAEKMEVSVDAYTSMAEEASVCTVFSLSEKWDESDDDDSLEKVEMIEDKGSLDPIESLNQKDVLRAITRSLTKKEKLIIIMYYYEGLTMREIGDIMSLTESRVCQIHSNIMGRLKTQLKQLTTETNAPL